MRRELLLVVVAGLSAAACVSPDAPGVRTDAVQTDIVFDAAEPDAEPLTGPVVASTDQQTAPLVPTPFRNQVPERFSNVRFSLQPEEAAADCPGAPLGAAPSEPAPANASAPPRAGLYRFKISGTRTETINGNELSSTYGGFEPHVIREVESSSPTLWSFQEVEQIADGVRVTTWQVNTDATQRSANTPYVGENSVRVGEPGRGVAITSIEEYDGNGNLRSAFDPSSPLLFLQLPVVQGESHTSTAVDPKSGQSITVDAEVERRQTVDACGTLVDGWFVSTTTTASQGFGSPASQYTEELVISTERGGQVISRRQVVSEPTTTGTLDADRTASLGQVDPSPAEERGA